MINRQMNLVITDGGRAAAGYKGKSRDCVTRSIAIAAQMDYQEVYVGLAALMKNGSPRNGVPKPIIRRYMASLGWQWVPTMQVGQVSRIHLSPGQLPGGRLVVNCSRHSTAVIDGVIHDDHDPCREGQRMVYGYYIKGLAT